MEGKESSLLKLMTRPELFEFEGISMVHYFTDNWEDVQNFQARPDDILIATYPKAGTTWVSYILDLLYFGNVAPERQTTIPISHRVPFLEAFFSDKTLSGVYLADNLPTTPRLIKTHLPIQLVPKSFWEQNCKGQSWSSATHLIENLQCYVFPPCQQAFCCLLYNKEKDLPINRPICETAKIVYSKILTFYDKVVYVARNAKDNAVSYFHFDRMNMGQPDPGDWNTYIQRFMKGEMVFGPWYDHVCGYWEKKQTYSNLHYMFFEDMAEDTGPEVERLCSFLGLSITKEERERIMKCIHFDAMKNNKMTNYSSSIVMDFTISPFMRKGKVGDWKNHFTVAQNEQFDEHYMQKMKDTNLQFRTEI